MQQRYFRNRCTDEMWTCETHDHLATAGMVGQRNPSVKKNILPHRLVWLVSKPRIHNQVGNILTVFHCFGAASCHLRYVMALQALR
jgi:hypothetical protein